MKVPFVIYADFECFTQNIETCTPDERKSYTKKYQKHTPSGFCYLIKCIDDKIFKPKVVTHTIKSEDEDVSQIFVDSLEHSIKEIYSKFKTIKKVKMTKEDEINYKNSTKCHICEEELNGDRVLDHCHITGRYRGNAHNDCQ